MEILQSLNINLQALVANLIGFLILLFLLKQFLFDPANKMLDERAQDVRVTYDKLEAEQRQMQELKSEYEQRLAAIEAEAREKIQSAIKEAQGTRDQIVSEANSRASELVSRAEAEVAREREQAMIAIREQVVNLALGATEKLIGDGLDEKRQRALIADFIANPTTAGAATVAKAPVEAQA
jgi:F-type H+-transporting ATPase subunit b